MSLNHYIDRQIIAKNRGIYFKKGRWIAHVLLLALYWLIMVTDNVDKPGDLTWHKGLIGTLPIVPYLCFFYYYCLYLVPYCFKQKRYKKFWTAMAALFVTIPLITLAVQYAIQWRWPGLLEGLKPAVGANIVGAYYAFFSSFVGYSAALYLMELLEEVSTVKETAQYKKEHHAVVLSRIKTQLNPAFMSESLGGIIQLAETGNAAAAESVIHFSDLLRYRLYKSRGLRVELNQELAQLQNLFTLQQLFPGPGNCRLEVDGNLGNTLITPMSLINLAEPLLQACRATPEGSLVMYLLVEETGIQVALELGTALSEETDDLLYKIREGLQQLIQREINFTIEKASNNYSIRTCIPITRPSTA